MDFCSSNPRIIIIQLDKVEVCNPVGDTYATLETDDNFSSGIIISHKTPGVVLTCQIMNRPETRVILAINTSPAHNVTFCAVSNVTELSQLNTGVLGERYHDSCRVVVCFGNVSKVIEHVVCACAVFNIVSNIPVKFKSNDLLFFFFFLGSLNRFFFVVNLVQVATTPVLIVRLSVAATVSVVNTVTLTTRTITARAFSNA
eukprot:Lithocolla_globosa_v1_NODE_3907_length_1551_cov_800.888518.p3 type:complete len:201 gc:universal NODE_3907_length_1551_cov_800.888518:977-375(-)